MQESGSEVISNGILVLLLVLFLSILGGYLLRQYNCKYMQEAGLATLLGIIFGGLLELFGESANLRPVTQLNVEFFLLFLLPPIIFESGYNMDKETFFTYFGPICMYAFMGTFLSALVISTLLFLAGYLLPITSLTLSECFAFGALISATDPVSVLAIMKDMHADKKLYTLIFGESIFNDAVTIALYRAIIDINNSDSSGSGVFVASAGRFLLVFFGSFIIGAIVALIASFVNYKQILKRVQAVVNRMNLEVVTVVFGPWISYLISEAMTMSGIVSILFCGIFMARYTYPNLSSSTRVMVAKAYSVCAHSCEVLVFIFLGMGLFSFNLPYEKMGFGLLFFAILIIHFGRAVNIVGNSWVLRMIGNKVSSKFQFIMWFSGLRGAIGKKYVAIALAIRALHDFRDGNGDVILTMTLIYALITVNFNQILFVAGAITPLLIKLDVLQQLIFRHNQIEEQVYQGGRCSQIMDFIKMIDKQHVYPFFCPESQPIMYEEQEDPNSSMDLSQLPP